MAAVKAHANTLQKSCVECHDPQRADARDARQRERRGAAPGGGGRRAGWRDAAFDRGLDALKPLLD